MSFTLPVGNFQPPVVAGIIRPTSVVDTVATGTITNSANAYDADASSYGVWTGVIPSSGPVPTYSTYVLTASGSTLGKSVYIKWSSNTDYPVWAGSLSMSIDGGSTYPYSINYYFPTTPIASNISSLVVPDSVLYTNIKFKIGMILGHGQPIGGNTDLRVYDIYIQ
jgi:hypothetical protein